MAPAVLSPMQLTTLGAHFRRDRPNRPSKPNRRARRPRARSRARGVARRWSALSIARRRPASRLSSRSAARSTKGDPICIIEVMKLFTTIHAEWSGTVKRNRRGKRNTGGIRPDALRHRTGPERKLGETRPQHRKLTANPAGWPPAERSKPVDQRRQRRSKTTRC